jgi:tetratricopeptide (TPR) repeat protein
VPRRGYRFVAPVVRQEEPVVAAAGEQPARGASRWVKRRPALVVSLAILLLIGVVGAISSWSPKRQPTAPSAAIKSIAVLPFKPLTANNRDEALELGMADTLTTKLSHLKQLIVRPTSAVRRWYSHYLMAVERFDEAIAEARLAIDLDPLSLVNNTQLGHSLWFARRYDQAAEQFRKTLEMDSNFVMARCNLGQVYTHQGKYSMAIAELQQVVASSRHSRYLAALGYAYAASGRRSDAIKTLEELNELSKHRYVSPYFVAVIYAGLGEKDTAFTWLDKACETRASYSRFLGVDPSFDGLRSDPRFQNLLRRMNLAP